MAAPAPYSKNKVNIKTTKKFQCTPQYLSLFPLIHGRRYGLLEEMTRGIEVRLIKIIIT